MTIYRVLGKKGRITIPYAIRKRIGFRYNDILSFTEHNDGSVVIKREKLCDNCIDMADEYSEDITLEDFLDIGEKLVLDCIEQGREQGFSVLQFNAVVATNIHARHLYERLGFTQLGTIQKGFRMKDEYYEDICPYYRVL